MNEQELKEKIVGAKERGNKAFHEFFQNELKKAFAGGAKHFGTKDCDKTIYDFEAEALIAAGIGDVSEWKHRAEVAERALRNAAPRLNCRGGLGKGFCRVDKCDYYHCNNDEGCVKAHLQQAEKELAEELEYGNE